MHKLTFVLISAFVLQSGVAIAGPHGEFVNKVLVEWPEKDDPNREVKLLEDFRYRDPSGRVWIAPKDWVVDGASIPWPLWNKFIGPPFVGNYRRASVVHDVACDQREAAAPSSQIVHRMFYDACLAGGVGEVKAWLMYWAVREFGCKWGEQDVQRVLSEDQYQELVKIDSEIQRLGIDRNSTEAEINRAVERLELFRSEDDL